MNLIIPKRSVIFTGINYFAFGAAVVGENYGYHSSQYFIWLIPALIAFLFLLYSEAKSLSHLGYDHTLRKCLKYSVWSGSLFPIPLFILLLLPSHIKGISIVQGITTLVSSLLGMLVFAGVACLLSIILLNQFFGLFVSKQ